MPEVILRPVQVFLDTQRLIQAPPRGSFGPPTDFFKNNNDGFRRHKKKLLSQLQEASEMLRKADDPAGFLIIQMRDSALGKSYRPLSALFTVPHRFALVGGGTIGQMYIQATPDGIDELNLQIERRAEIFPELKEDKNGNLVERVTVWRSELGAIDEIRLPNTEDRLSFSARDGVGWLEQENAIGGYNVELFRPDLRVTPRAVTEMVDRFRERLRSVAGIMAVPYRTAMVHEGSVLTLNVDLRADDLQIIDLPIADEQDVDEPIDSPKLSVPIHPAEGISRDRNLSRHQALLDLLAAEPMVRRIELPLRIESSTSFFGNTPVEAHIPAPLRDQAYPAVGIIDAGVSDTQILSPWRVGSTGLITPSDRDEAHGTFIAGLLAGAAALNPALSDRLESTPCSFFDIDILPRRGMISRYYQTPDEFFDQLDLQVESAKANLGIRIFNMSLGSPNARQGLGYSSFAANLDRIARKHDVIFVVSAGNLRGRSARPEWSGTAQDALEMLATRAIADERITAPGEHLYGITVGAINPTDVPGAFGDVPTTYSRRGPGPGGARKPEFAHIGGVTARGGNNTGLFSIAPDGSYHDGSGTSFATPLVSSSLAAIDQRLHGTAPRESVMGLLAHRAAKPEALQAKALRAVVRDFVGFGVPKSAEACLSDDPHSITLVFADILPPKRELFFEFSWPRSLTSNSGKCRGRIDVTLVHTPPIDPAFDAECQRVQLYAALHQLEEKLNADGEIIIEPQSRSNHCDSELPQHLSYTERYLLEGGLKWTPIKRYEKNMPKGCGTRSEWRLTLKALTRAGAIYPEESVPFSLILTITDPKGAAPIYEEVRAEILRRGLRLADVTIEQRVRARGA